MTGSPPGADTPRGTWFQRFLLPGFAFRAVVIGGGYATGRELAEFFVLSGPWGGLAAMPVAMALWSLIRAAIFALAALAHAYDYRAFFRLLLGRGWCGGGGDRAGAVRLATLGGGAGAGLRNRAGDLSRRARGAPFAIVLAL